MSNAVKIYKDTNFRGSSAELHEGNYPVIPGAVGNDNISSVTVPSGYYARFYQDYGFRGASIVLFQGDYNNLPGWNDKISSIEVLKHNDTLFPLVEFYEDTNYRGYRQTLAGTGKDTNYSFPFFKNDSISSMTVPPGTTVILFEHGNLQGEQKEFSGGVDTPFSVPDLRVYGWNDKVSSVKIVRPSLKLVNIEYLEEIASPNGDPITISSSTKNETDLEQNARLTLSRELSQSSERTWSNSTLIGLSTSVSKTVGVSGKALSAEVSATITATLENTFTIGKNEINAESIFFQKEVEIKVPPHSIGKISMTLTPKKYKVKVRYTFEVEGTKQRTTEDAEIIVENYHQGEAVINA